MRRRWRELESATNGQNVRPFDDLLMVRDQADEAGQSHGRPCPKPALVNLTQPSPAEYDQRREEGHAAQTRDRDATPVEGSQIAIAF